MQIHILEFQSYTSVLHAHDLLSSNGISSDIEKSISTTSGCIYVIKIISGYEAASRILSSNGIPFTLKA